MGFMLWVFSFFFFLKGIAVVLCSWFKEMGTNTLTGWGGTEPLPFSVWWTSLLMTVPVAGKVGH